MRESIPPDLLIVIYCIFVLSTGVDARPKDLHFFFCLPCDCVRFGAALGGAGWLAISLFSLTARDIKLRSHLPLSAYWPDWTFLVLADHSTRSPLSSPSERDLVRCSPFITWTWLEHIVRAWMHWIWMKSWETQCYLKKNHFSWIFI